MWAGTALPHPPTPCMHATDAAGRHTYIDTCMNAPQAPAQVPWPSVQALASTGTGPLSRAAYVMKVPKLERISSCTLLPLVPTTVERFICTAQHSNPQQPMEPVVARLQTHVLLHAGWVEVLGGAEPPGLRIMKHALYCSALAKRSGHCFSSHDAACGRALVPSLPLFPPGPLPPLPLAPRAAGVASRTHLRRGYALDVLALRRG